MRLPLQLGARGTRELLLTPAVEVRQEAAASFTVADNSVLHQHADHKLLPCPPPVPHKRPAAVPR